MNNWLPVDLHLNGLWTLRFCLLFLWDLFFPVWVPFSNLPTLMKWSKLNSFWNLCPTVEVSQGIQSMCNNKCKELGSQAATVRVTHCRELSFLLSIFRLLPVFFLEITVCLSTVRQSWKHWALYDEIYC